MKIPEEFAQFVWGLHPEYRCEALPQRYLRRRRFD
jgi:hypothetical protein